MNRLSLLALAAVLGLASCQKEEVAPSAPEAAAASADAVVEPAASFSNPNVVVSFRVTGSAAKLTIRGSNGNFAIFKGKKVENTSLGVGSYTVVVPGRSTQVYFSGTLNRTVPVR